MIDMSYDRVLLTLLFVSFCDSYSFMIQLLLINECLFFRYINSLNTRATRWDYIYSHYTTIHCSHLSHILPMRHLRTLQLMKTLLKLNIIG